MEILLNGTPKTLKLETITTLGDIIDKVLPPGQVVTEAVLNDKPLDEDWFQNSAKIYLLDEDRLSFTVSDSTKEAHAALVQSREFLADILTQFQLSADSFRVQDEATANSKFVNAIQNLRDYLKMLEEATFMLGRPLDKIKDRDIFFSQHIVVLCDKLDAVIKVQQDKDWVNLADQIEYEMIPSIKQIAILYYILDIPA